MTPEFLKRTFYESLEILEKVYGPPDFERARTNIRELLTQAVAKLKDLQELSRWFDTTQTADNMNAFRAAVGKPAPSPGH